jgi:hypothetical protein
MALTMLAIVASVALLFSACDDAEDNDASDADAAGSVSLEHTVLITAMNAYRTEGLHELDDEVQAASEMGAGWSGTLSRLHTVTAATEWPADLSEAARDLESELSAAVAAIKDDDLTAAKEHIGLAHAAWHDLEHDTYAMLAGEVDEGHDPADASSGVDDHAAADDEASTTPMSGDIHMDALEIPAGEPVPTVELIVHEDAKAGWNLEIVTTNFTFAPEHASTEHVAGEGHAHLYVDGVKIGRVYGDWYHLAELESGDHEVRVTLNANDHRDLATGGETIAATVMIHAGGM